MDCMNKLKNNKVCSANLCVLVQAQPCVGAASATPWDTRLGWGGLFLTAVPRLPCSQEYLEFRKERSQMLLSRRNQMLLEFSFWNEPQPRAGPNIYELRTYKLKVPPSHQIPACAHLPCFSAALQVPLHLHWAFWPFPLGPEQRCVRTCAHMHTHVRVRAPE